MSEAIKSYISYVKDSFPEILKTVALVGLVSSGIIVGALLRYVGLDGTAIFTFSLLVQVVTTTILGYLAPRGFIYERQPDEEAENAPKPKK